MLVHASLRTVGPVVAGAGDVVRALLDAVGPRGTVVVPTYTAGNSDPSRWAFTRGRAVPRWQRAWLRARMPAFDPATTPSQRMGAVAEAVRTWPGARRSDHPQTSFAAVGAHADDVVDGHARDCHLGPASPLGRLHDRDAQVLLLGVPWAVCSAFHLAEYLVPDPPTRDYECVVRDGGRRAWYRYRDVLLDDGDFQQLGEAMEEDGGVRRARVGEAVTRLFPIRDAVAFASGRFAAGRPAQRR